LFLRNRPVTAVSSVTVDGVAIQASSPAPTGAGYLFDDSSVYLVGQCFTKGVQNVVIQYSAGGQFRPSDGANEAPFSGQVAQEFPPLFARPPIVPKELPRFKEPVPRLSGKEGAKDIPSWARGLQPYVGENGRDFAKRAMDQKYGPGKWDENGREYKQMQKYRDRNFRDPKSIVGPDDDEA
jgi:hypothetical protein